jgi:probable addiction module antidote protein
MRKRKTTSYKDDLLADLKDLDYAATYLSTALSDSKEVFLIALRDVAEAQKGISKLALEAQVNRENLYRMLSEQGNPRLETLKAVLRGVGLKIEFQPERAMSVRLAPAKRGRIPRLLFRPTRNASHRAGAPTIRD